MKVTYDVDARRRPVNLTLSEDLVVQARALTKAKAIDTTVAMWNDFNAKRGSFADEYSTL